MSITAPLQIAGGIFQAISGRKRARKAESALENLEVPTYAANKSILDYYNKALARYSVDPSQSALYKRSMQDVDRGVAGAVAGLQDRKSAVGGLASILRASSDAKLNAEVAAERQRDQRFSELQGATGMKAGDERLQYQYNQLAPFEKNYNLLSAKAAGGNQLMNAGMLNIFGGLQSIDRSVDQLAGLMVGMPPKPNPNYKPK